MKAFVKKVGPALSAAIVATVVAGCGGGGGGGSTDGTASTPVPTPTPTPTPSPTPGPTPAPTPTGVMKSITAPPDLLLTAGTATAGLPTGIPAGAEVTGVYGPATPWPFISVHASLLPNGRVLTYGSTGGSFGSLSPINSRTYSPTQWGIDFDEWTPERGAAPIDKDGLATHRTLSDDSLQYDSFCTTSKLLPDGTLMIAGGNGPGANPALNGYNGKYGDQTTETRFWDPTTSTLKAPGTGFTKLSESRWYASLVRMPDDSVVVVGGGYSSAATTVYDRLSPVARYPEVFNQATGWRPLTGVGATFGNQDYWKDYSRWWYPRAYLGPNGKIFAVAGPSLLQLDPAGNGTMKDLGSPLGLPPVATANPADRETSVVGVSNSSVMYAPGKILMVGGGQYYNDATSLATRGAVKIDISTINGSGDIVPQVTQLQSMTYYRNWVMATVLPTGEVMVHGGGPVGTGNRVDGQTPGYDGAAPLPDYVRQDEIWNPTTQQFRLGATHAKGRVYHQVALLLPSGAVYTGGGGVPGYEAQLNAEVYYPPYLFKNNGGTVTWADRPVMTSISDTIDTIKPGQSFKLTMSDARVIADVNAISTGAVTHGHNNDQRRIPLTFTRTGNELTITLAAVNTMPPGHYMLHAVDAAGVPSRGYIFQVFKP